MILGSIPYISTWDPLGETSIWCVSTKRASALHPVDVTRVKRRLCLMSPGRTRRSPRNPRNSAAEWRDLTVLGGIHRFESGVVQAAVCGRCLILTN